MLQYNYTIYGDAQVQIHMAAYYVVDTVGVSWFARGAVKSAWNFLSVRRGKGEEQIRQCVGGWQKTSEQEASQLV